MFQGFYIFLNFFIYISEITAKNNGGARLQTHANLDTPSAVQHPTPICSNYVVFLS